MNPLLGALYGAGVALADTLSAVAPSSESKIWHSLRARRGLLDRWRAQAASRDHARPLVWMHAPSVGEGLQARPVAHALRATHADWQQAYSFFSPSAERFATSVSAEFCDYLPFDSTRAADTLLQLLSPHALVFSKLDVWPVLVARARHAGVPVAMISATLAAQSSRRGGLSSALLRDAYAALDAVGAIDAENAERLVSLGVRRDVIRVTGDTRFDQVAQRAATVDRTSPLLTLLASDRPTLVAGSTWPADEAMLCAAWESVHYSTPSARLIIAPHEPTSTHVQPLLNWARTNALEAMTLSEAESRGRADSLDVIVVDRVGVLGELYALANVAFVGGGFHTAGLHSVIEPAAFGIPVLFGPRHHMSREAGLLLESRGAESVDSAPAIADMLNRWISAHEIREEAGMRARLLVEAELGSTGRSVGLIESLIP
ncbi:MAG: hypothetical protein IBJ03_00475 [Gemmatimonadaceae bacterium]|nr:hypothetical protein [Gemmatimonadaceae bacterium]